MKLLPAIFLFFHFYESVVSNTLLCLLRFFNIGIASKLLILVKNSPIHVIAAGYKAPVGIPPMNGFVSKWFIYRALILNGYPFLAIAAVIGTPGTLRRCKKSSPGYAASNPDTRHSCSTIRCVPRNSNVAGCKNPDFLRTCGGAVFTNWNKDICRSALHTDSRTCIFCRYSLQVIILDVYIPAI